MLEQIHEAGRRLHEQGKYNEALQLWDRASCAMPDNPVVHFGMASSLANLGLSGSALAIMRLSVQVAPEVPDNWYQLGQCLRRTQDYEASRRAYDKALSLKCSKDLLLYIYTAYAGTYVNAGEPEKGLEWIDKALDIDPDFSHAVNAKALLLLESGRYDEGWPLYAKRWRSPGYLVREYPGIEQWDGEQADTLIIHAEQGLGDEILFASGIPALKPFSPNILGECQGRLIELFRRSFPYVKWFATHEELTASNSYASADPVHSAWFRMGDLLSVMGPRPKPFLKADPAKVAGYKARMNAIGPGPHVGFSWKGGSPETHERYRNAPKDRWRDLLQKCKGTAVSLQYGPGEKLGLPHWDCAINDLDEFAALVAACDLVISCCGATVHFAGGLGVPCWAAVPKECAWRYAGDTMRWYDSVKMYKGAWDKVFYGIGYDLEHL